MLTYGSQADCNGLIKRGIHEREQQAWQQRMEQKPKLVKLVTYRKLKKRRRCEDYLHSSDVRGRALLARLRMGTHELMVEQGRYHNILREQRTCHCVRMAWMSCMW